MKSNITTIGGGTGTFNVLSGLGKNRKLNLAAIVTVADSGGSTGACNGQLTLDWNAFQTTFPGSLGNPWTAGDEAYVQGWFRDPTSCKTTSLSNAVILTY